jgi:phosphomannomutase
LAARTAFDFTFAENGLTAFKGTDELKGEVTALCLLYVLVDCVVQSVLDFLGEERMQKFINFTLRYIADLEIPQKR